MKKFITGFFVGAVSLIPGISGGTILFISKEFETFILALTSKKNINNLKYLFIIISGIIIGAILCAKIIEYLFNIIPFDLLLLFSIFLLFSILALYKEEKSNINIKWLFVGCILIFILALLTTNSNYTYEVLPNLTFPFLIFFFFCGMLDGFITILPGISGSMVMMILGPYYLYKSFLANLDCNHLVFLFPLGLYLIGDLLGIYFGSLFSKIMLNKYKSKFFSIILGMMLTSTLILLPINNLDKLHFPLLISIFIIYLLIKKTLK